LMTFALNTRPGLLCSMVRLGLSLRLAAVLVGVELELALAVVELVCLRRWGSVNLLANCGRVIVAAAIACAASVAMHA
jgi:hypothetical protein